eukprot:8221048-Pyramimonas_sp.AAC.1
MLLRCIQTGGKKGCRVCRAWLALLLEGHLLTVRVVVVLRVTVKLTALLTAPLEYLLSGFR